MSLAGLMLRNTLKILSGTVIAQGLGFVALPLLTRQFTPEAFGLLQLFQACMGLMLVVAAMRYEIALMRAAQGRELSATLHLCGVINLAMTAFVALGCLVAAFGPWQLSAASLALLWWLPAGMLAGGALQTLGYLALRREAFSVVATGKVAQAVGTVAASSGLGLIWPWPAGLVVADIVGRIASAGVISLQRSLAVIGRTRLCWADLAAAARKFREYPAVSVPGGLVNAAGGTMTSVMMFSFFDAGTAGQFGLVERALILPVAMIAGAISQVFTAGLSAALRGGGAQPVALFRRLLLRMFLLGLGPALLVALVAPSFFQWLFGPSWAQAGEFARVMSPVILMVLVTTPVNMAIMLAGYQKTQFGWEVFRLLAMLLAWLWLTSKDVPAVWAVAVHVAVISCTSLVYLVLADFMLRHHARVQHSGPR